MRKINVTFAAILCGISGIPKMQVPRSLRDLFCKMSMEPENGRVLQLIPLLGLPNKLHVGDSRFGLQDIWRVSSTRGLVSN